MPHQTNKAQASVTWFTPEPEIKETKKEETKQEYKEPEGEPSY